MDPFRGQLGTRTTQQDFSVDLAMRSSCNEDDTTKRPSLLINVNNTQHVRGLRVIPSEHVTLHQVERLQSGFTHARTVQHVAAVVPGQVLRHSQAHLLNKSQKEPCEEDIL